MIAPSDDIDRIMAVMQAAFPREYGEAWNRRQVEDALLLGNCHYQLISASGEKPQEHEPAAGFFLSRHVLGEEELLLLAVSPDHRRKGLANKLLIILENDSINRGTKRLLLEMRRGNPAELLYLARGFRPIGQRPRYYRTLSGEQLDAITFCKEIG